jgi:hypothetical protein
VAPVLARRHCRAHLHGLPANGVLIVVLSGVF